MKGNLKNVVIEVRVLWGKKERAKAGKRESVREMSKQCGQFSWNEGCMKEGRDKPA